MTMGWNGGLDDGWRRYASGIINCIFYKSLFTYTKIPSGKMMMTN